MTERCAVVLVSDEGAFAPAVFLASRLASLNRRRDTDVVVISDWDAGVRAAAGLKLPVKFEPGNFDRFRRMPRLEHISPAAYFRILLPGLFADRYRRLLYLDVDTYPVSDRLFGLFDLDLANMPLAAVRSIAISFGSHFKEYRDRLGVPLGGKYLNSGVLLMDVTRYRTQDVEARVLETIERREKDLRQMDQSAFNLTLNGGWAELSPAFNMNFAYQGSEIADFFRPEIIHFLGKRKPWSIRSPAEGHPARKELLAFLADSPWPDFMNRRPHHPPKKQHPVRRLARMLGLAGKPPARKPKAIALAEVLRYLAETEFIDVRQGLTAPGPFDPNEIRAA